MKNFLLFFFSIIVSIQNLFAQAWAMDEVAEDARETESLSIMDVIYGVLFLSIILCIYKIFTSKKKVSRKKYIVTRNSSIVIFVILAITIPTISEITLYKKYVKMYENTKNFILRNSTNTQFLSNSDYFYSSVNQLSSQVKAVEMQDFYFFKYRDNYDDSFSEYMEYMRNNLVNELSCEEYPIIASDPIIKSYEHPYSDTVYSTYSIIQSPKIEIWNTVSSTGEHKNARLKTPIHYNHFPSRIPNIEEESSPYLIQVSIVPDRIRYFKREGNVQYDIVEAFKNYIKDDLTSPNSNSEYKENLMKEIIDYNNNPFFEILWSCNGKRESIENREIRGYGYGEEKTSSVFLYDLVNYGDFEIMYGISDIKFWTINSKWCSKKFLFWEISKDNWYDCQLTYTVCKYFSMLLTFCIFVIIYLVKLKKRIIT